jgi:hypothetical protein
MVFSRYGSFLSFRAKVEESLTVFRITMRDVSTPLDMTKFDNPATSKGFVMVINLEFQVVFSMVGRESEPDWRYRARRSENGRFGDPSLPMFRF